MEPIRAWTIAIVAGLFRGYKTFQKPRVQLKNR
jgi:hypothetical protein